MPEGTHVILWTMDARSGWNWRRARKGGITFWLVGLIVLPTLGQMTPEALDHRMDDLILQFGGKPKELLRAYHTLIRSEGYPQNCDSVAIAGFIWLHLQPLQNWEDEPYPGDTAICPVGNYQLHAAFAAEAFRQQNSEDLMRHMRLALATASEPFQRLNAWQGIGVAFQMQNQLDSAYRAFVQSYAVHPESGDAMSMNNLANAALIAEEWSAAKEWTIKAEEFYFLALRKGWLTEAYGPQFMDLVLSNRLYAEMQLGDITAGNETFKRMQFVAGEDRNSVMMAATVLTYLVWSDQPDKLLSIEPSLSELLMLDSALAVETLGAHILLVEPWRSSWRELTGETDQALWDRVMGMPFSFRDSALPKVNSGGQQKGSTWRLPRWLPWIAAVGILAVLLGLSGMFYERRQLRGMPNPDLAGKVQSALQHKQQRSARIALRLLAQRTQMQSFQFKDLLAELSPREREVFEAWRLGERPKDSAQRLEITTASVYNVRAVIRRKLGIPNGSTLEEWMNQKGMTKSDETSAP